jgi:hypothetical protein
MSPVEGDGGGLGTIAGRFELLAEAGAGGMGTVYRARDVQTGDVVAVKLMHAGEGAERFEREAEILATIAHPAIVRYLAHGTTADDELFIAMEWLEGKTLQEVLADGPLSVEGAVALGARVAGALAAAHAQAVIHRDLKPSNLFLEGGDPARAKVVDFGVARLGDVDRQLTRTGQVIGTPGYMAPEQARGRREIDARADLFALGCVLFRALAGRAPFEGDDVLSLLAALVLHHPPPLRSLDSSIPSALEALVAELLAKEPDERPESAAAVEERLLAVARDPSAARATLPPEGVRPIVVIAARGETGAQMGADTLGEVRRRVAEHGGSVEELAGGAIAASLEDEGPASVAHTEAVAAILRDALHTSVSLSRHVGTVEAPVTQRAHGIAPRRRRWPIAVAAVIALGGGAAALYAVRSPGSPLRACVPPDGLVIHEFRTRGPAGGLDEFVELYNAGPSAVTLTAAWVLKSRPKGGTQLAERFVGSGQVVEPGHFFLLRGESYSGDATADAPLGSGISDEGAMTLHHAETLVDAVCFRCGPALMREEPCEGAPADKHGCSGNVDKSVSRDPSADCLDSGENAADFREIEPSEPRNGAGSSG